VTLWSWHRCGAPGPAAARRRRRSGPAGGSQHERVAPRARPSGLGVDTGAQWRGAGRPVLLSGASFPGRTPPPPTPAPTRVPTVYSLPPSRLGPTQPQSDRREEPDGLCPARSERLYKAARPRGVPTQVPGWARSDADTLVFLHALFQARARRPTAAARRGAAARRRGVATERAAVGGAGCARGGGVLRLACDRIAVCRVRRDRVRGAVDDDIRLRYRSCASDPVLTYIHASHRMQRPARLLRRPPTDLQPTPPTLRGALSRAAPPGDSSHEYATTL